MAGNSFVDDRGGFIFTDMTRLDHTTCTVCKRPYSVPHKPKCKNIMNKEYDRNQT